MPTTDALLDLQDVNQRTSTFRFLLLDQTLAAIGEVHPTVTPPSISLDTSRPVMRTLDSLQFAPGELDDVNPFIDLVRVQMVMENGAVEDCGIFAFDDQSDALATYGNTTTVSLLDLSSFLNEGASKPIVVKAGTNAGVAAQTLIAMGALPTSAVIDPTVFAPAEDLAFPAGTAPLAVLNQIAALAGWFPFYVDRHGVPRLRLVPSLSSVDPDFTVGAGRFYTDSAVVSSGLLSAPNRYLAVDSGTTAAPVVGVWDVPDAAPNSIRNRGGRAKTKTTRVQGLGTQAAADTAAMAFGQLDQATYTHGSYTGPPDPRHDPFATVAFLGVNYLETGWRMALREGDPMSHDLRLVYS